MKKKLPYLVILLASLIPFAVSVGPMALTGCGSLGGSSTNSFDAVKAAKNINMTLGPVVVLVENLEPASIKPFQDAQAAIGVLVSNGSSDVAVLRTALAGISTNPYISAAIQLAVNEYENYLADAVTGGLNKNDVATILLRDGFEAALKQGIQANKSRVKAHRRALRLASDERHFVGWIIGTGPFGKNGEPTHQELQQ